MRLPSVFVSLAFSSLLLGCTGGGGNPPCSTCALPPELESNVANVYFGDPLPAPTRVTGIEDVAGVISRLFLVAEGAPPSWLKVDDFAVSSTLFPAYPGQLDRGAFTVTDPIVTPGTGTFRLSDPGKFTTKPFTVTGRQPAYVQCLDATVIAGAASQTPPSFRGKLGGCTMTRGGGDTVGKQVLKATCSTPKGMSECDYSAAQSVCTGGSPLPLAQRRVPGDAVMMTWSGGDVPSGAASVTVPATIDVGPVPAEHLMTNDLELTFTGGADAGTVRMTLFQDTTGSLVAIDCEVDATAGRVKVPNVAFNLLEKGAANVTFTNLGVQRVKAAEWEVEASAIGLVTQSGTLVSAPFMVKLQR